MNTGKNHAQEIENSLSKAESLRKWRIEKVWQLKSVGCTIDEIAAILKGQNPKVKISVGTVHHDLKIKQDQIRKEFQKYIEEELPIQHRLAVTGLEQVIKEAWLIQSKEQDSKLKLAALSVRADAIMKLQAVMGDPIQIERAIKTVAQLKKELAKSTEEEEEEEDKAE